MEADVLAAFDRERTGEPARPGKFEGEAPWVPYLWLSDGGDDCYVEDGKISTNLEAVTRRIREEICKANGVDPDSDEGDMLMESDDFELDGLLSATSYGLTAADLELFPSLGKDTDYGKDVSAVALREREDGFVEFVGASGGGLKPSPQPEAGPAQGATRSRSPSP